MNGIYIMAPFLAIHILETLGKPDSFLGLLVASQMAGGVAGNFASGFIGDRWGGKILMCFARLVFVILALLTMIVGTDGLALLIFFLFGVSFYLDRVGTMTMGIEMCPERKRPTYLSMLAAINIPFMLCASFTGTVTLKLTGAFAITSVISIVAVATSLLILIPIPEPRSIDNQKGKARGFAKGSPA
ncbi:MAG: MFS transporter [Lentisphaerae bacterium]|nr:MFS transporter [Lentisphaerota bacterium]